MKIRFTANSKVLADRLSVLSRLHPSMLEPTILFEAKGDTLTMKAFDSEARLESRLETTDGEGEGSFIISSRWILEVLGRVPSQPVTLEAEDGRMNVSYSNGHMSCMTYRSEGDMFPYVLSDADAMAAMPLSTLQAALRRTLPFASTDDTRPVLRSVLMDMGGDGSLHMVATDSRTVADMELLNATVSRSGNERMQAVLPAAKAQILLRAAEKSDGEAVIRTGEGLAEAVTSTFRMTIKTTEGSYPDYRRITGMEYGRTFTAGAKEMTSCLERMRQFAEAGTAVSMEPGEGSVKLSARSETMKKKARETVACETEGVQAEPLNVNAVMLSAILGLMGDANASFGVGRGGRMVSVSPANQRDDMKETCVMACLQGA